MTTRKGLVYCHGIQAGVIDELPEGGYRFRYNPDYEGPSISLTLPREKSEFESRFLFPFFDGLIPEGWLLSITIKNWKLNENDRMGLLLATCSETIGAVTVLPAGFNARQNQAVQVNRKQRQAKAKLHKPSNWSHCPVCLEPVNNNSLYHPACCRTLFDSDSPPVIDFNQKDINELARQSVLARITIPGVQKKLSVSISEEAGKNNRITITNLWGSYILKPPSEDYPEVPANEHLTLQLARQSRIETENFGLLPLADGTIAFIARRFDRQKTDRFACEDFAQLTGRTTIEKYKGSLEQAAKPFKLYSKTPGEDLLRFFELNLFSFLTGNADMHLKNFSLLGNKAGATAYEFRLSPAYDLLNTDILLEKDIEETALTLNAKNRKIKYSDFITFARTIGIPSKAASVAIERMLSTADHWDSTIQRSFLSDDFKQIYFENIQTRVRKFKKSLRS